MVHRWIWVALASFFLSVSASAAIGPDTAPELWRAGKYEQAIEAGTAANTAEGLSVAARAAVSDVMTRIPPCLDCVHRAQDLARKAIAADPKAPLPHVYLAVSLGYEARIVGLLESQRKGLGEESKSALEAAIAADPKNAFAIATLGGWNIDTVRIGGSFLARLTYGATIDEGIAKYTQAIAMDPEDLVIHYQYALSLAGCDADKYHDVIAEQLARATQGKPESVYESVSQKRASDLLGLLKAGDRQAFADQVKRYMGIPE
jgi:tetratricopeptide (TPR) repeat protein